MSPEYQKAWRKAHPDFKPDQVNIGIKHATYAKLQAIKRTERTTFDKVLNLLIEKKENALVLSKSADMKVPVPEETSIGKNK
jgi:predicted CopG family antitoxin